MAENVKCWAIVDKSSGSGDLKFRIIADPNQTDEKQTAIVEIVSEDGSIVKEIFLDQAPRKTYYSARIEKNIQKNDCAADEKGSIVTVVIPEGKHKSYISQDDADNKAKQDLELNGQNVANEEGICEKSIWYNERMTKTFYKECPDGTRTPVEYVVDAGKYSSIISQPDADRQAQEDIDANGQAYADEHGVCATVYRNVEVEDVFSPICQEGFQPVGEFPYVIEAGEFTSTISQDDADRQAREALQTRGQANADEKGECKEIFYNERQSGMFKKECPNGDGPMIEYVVEAGTITSLISLPDANQKAKDKVAAEGQEYANTHGTCPGEYIGEYSAEFPKTNCPDGGVGSSVTVTQDDVTGGPFISTVNQEAANELAKTAVDAQGPAIANERGTCTWTGSFSHTFTKECPEGQVGSEVEVTEADVEGGPFTSTVSLAAANKLAEDAVMAGGQQIANERGTCTTIDANPRWEDVTPEELRCLDGVSQKKQIDTNPNSPTYNQTRWIDGGNKVCTWVGTCESVRVKKNDCEIPEAGSEVIVSVDMIPGYPGSVTSVESEDAANLLACQLLEANKQTIANERGACGATGTCDPVSLKRTDCPECHESEAMQVTVEMVNGGPFIANPGETQDEVNARACAFLNENAQTYVNKNGPDCVPSSTDPVWVDSDPLETRCENGVSQKKQVNTNPCYTGVAEQWVAGGGAVCEWTAADKIVEYTRTCDGTGVGGTVSVASSELPGYPFKSTVGQPEADKARDDAFTAHGLEVAATKPEWICTWTGVYSKSIQKNDCTNACEMGQSYTVTQDMMADAPFTSSVSQEDANNKAKAAVEGEEGQAIANKNVLCVADPSKANATWTDTGSTQCSGCTAQKEQKDTNACSSTYNQTKWVNGGSRNCSNNGTWSEWSWSSCDGCSQSGTRTNSCGGSDSTTRDCSSWDYVGSGDCVGHTQYEAYRNSCTGNTDRQYSVDCYNCCNCGSPSGKTEDGCSGNQVKYRWTDDCGRTTYTYETVPGKCGAVYSATMTSNVEKCKEGCTCPGTCIPAHDSRTSSTATSTTSQSDANNKALDAANAKAQELANAGSCGTVYSHQASAITESSAVRDNCGSGCTGTAATRPKSEVPTQTACTQEEANDLAQSWYDSNKQSYANSNGGCDCPQPCVCSITGEATIRQEEIGSALVHYTLTASKQSGNCYLPVVTFSFNTGAFVDVQMTSWDTTQTDMARVDIPLNTSWDQVTVTAGSTCSNNSIDIHKS